MTVTAPSVEPLQRNYFLKGSFNIRSERIKYRYYVRRLAGVFLALLAGSGLLFVSVLPGDTKENYAIALGEDDCGDSQQALSGSVINLYSDHVLLIRLEDFEILGEFQGSDSIYPASLTKIMTTILAIEALDNFDEEIYIQPAWIQKLCDKNASMAGFVAGEAVCVRDLLYATLLPSGADAAVALACRVSGSEEAFTGLMNEKARSLGMGQTHFANATGLHDDTHVTTLKDMALLVDYALDNAIFRRVFTTHEYQTAPTPEHANGIYFESTLFGKMDEVSTADNSSVDTQGCMAGHGWILGGKTGYTPQAGLCLASLAQIDDKEYLLLTAGACGDTTTRPYHILDAVEIYEHIK